jgi:phosphoadenosine phosphosulfate reductase
MSSIDSLQSLGIDLESDNKRLESLTAEERVAWALEKLDDRIILSTSFGAQSAVCLHLVTTLRASIPVVLIDTGYLFPETYHFADELTQRLKLNLKIYRSELSPAWQKARYGKLWEQGVDGIRRYNQINKVEPMQRALNELNALGWIAGLRRQQASTRKQLSILERQDGRLKIYPIIDWTDRDIHQYLTRHNLPYHPLWEQGYVSIGDVHTTRQLEEGMTEEETRFFGLKRECGLHEPSK